MNLRIVLSLSLAANLLLALYVVRQAVTPQPPAEAVPTPAEPISARPGSQPNAAPRMNPDSSPPAVRTFTWESVESPDYREYIANLRAIGCPEETIRDIIVADVSKLYASKKREVRGEPAKFEYWKAGNPWMGQLDADYLARSRALEEEKLGVLRQLGIEPDLNMQMASLTDAATAMDSLLGFLPEDKQVRVMKLMQDMQTEMAETAQDGGVDAKALQDAQRKMEAAIRQVLSPEEFRDYELRMSMTANTMRSQLAGWDPDEQEFLKVYELRKTFDDEFSMFPRGNESEAEWSRRQAAEQQLNQAIREALGESRYTAYERAKDWTFQQIQQAAKRADLGTTEAVQVYEMKQAAEAEARNLRNNRELTQEQRIAALQGIRSETERSIRQVLGDEGWNQYDRGYNTSWLKTLVPRAPSPPAGE
jgi:hypothetical protein